VTIELIHKDARYDGPIKVHNVSCWPLNSKVVQFLLVTESVYSIKELEKVEKLNIFSSLSANFSKASAV
jgi:hypothetical protein